MYVCACTHIHACTHKAFSYQIFIAILQTWEVWIAQIKLQRSIWRFRCLSQPAVNSAFPRGSGKALPAGNLFRGQHPCKELTPSSELGLCSILYFGAESSPYGCFVSSSYNVIESIALTWYGCTKWTYIIYFWVLRLVRSGGQGPWG